MNDAVKNWLDTYRRPSRSKASPVGFPSNRCKRLAVVTPVNLVDGHRRLLASRSAEGGVDIPFLIHRRIRDGMQAVGNRQADDRFLKLRSRAVRNERQFRRSAPLPGHGQRCGYRTPIIRDAGSSAIVTRGVAFHGKTLAANLELAVGNSGSWFYGGLLWAEQRPLFESPCLEKVEPYTYIQDQRSVSSQRPNHR